jgi:hypothetical protein
MGAMAGMRPSCGSRPKPLECVRTKGFEV